MCEFILWSNLKPSEQAAWVQAIGSVIAILVAVAVPAVGGWFKSRAEQRIRREKMLNAVIQIFDQLSSLLVSLEEFYLKITIDYDSDGSRPSVDPHQGDFQSLMPSMITLISSLSLLNEMGHLAPAMRKFLFKLIDLDRFLKIISTMQRNGFHAYWINNIDDIREKTKDVISCAGVLNEEIKRVMEAANQS